MVPFLLDVSLSTPEVPQSQRVHGPVRVWVCDRAGGWVEPDLRAPLRALLGLAPAPCESGVDGVPLSFAS